MSSLADMVARQIAARGVTHPAVLNAMGSVDRAQFVPRDQIRHAYLDTPLPIGRDQTISQPFMVARMTELLDPEPGRRVLEIGTGCGYQTAILAATGVEVFSIERQAPLHREAVERLAGFGVPADHLRRGNGFAGWPEHAPYDGILLTAAPEHLPPALLAQLAPGGRLVAPLGPVDGEQFLYRFIRQPDGRLLREAHGGVRFVPMIDAD